MNAPSITLRITLLKAGLVAAFAAPIFVVAGCNKEVQFAGNSGDKVDPKVVVDQEFPAALLGDEALKLAPNYGKVTQALTLAEKAPTVKGLRQGERALLVDAFTQGHAGLRSEEDFDVSKIGKLDLLVVIDNSGSMGDEQALVKTQLPSLTKFIANTDWRIAVVTTDSGCLSGGKVILHDSGTADADFAAAIDAGVGGSGSERGLYYAAQGLKGLCETDATKNYTGWIRPDASLGVLIISDENNTCTTPAGKDCTKQSERDNEVPLLVAYMQGIKAANPTKLRAYALTFARPSGDPRFECVVTNGQSNGAEYMQWVKAINGAPAAGTKDPSIAGSICDKGTDGNGKDAYKATLEAISKDVSRTITHNFDLKFEPAAKSIDLAMDGKSYSDFTIVGKSIVLNNVPADALKLSVIYRYNAEPVYDRFHLSKTPDPATLVAYVNNKKIDATKVTYDDANQEIYFLDMPTDDAAIKVKFRDASTALADNFDFQPADLVGDPVSIAVDGKTAAGWKFDAATKIITFDTPPADDAAIDVSYRTLAGRILSYKAALQGGEEPRHAPVAVDAATGKGVAVTLENGQLVFGQADVEAGRKIDVTYDYGDAGDMMDAQLAHDPLEGTVVITATGEDGKDCVDEVKVEGRDVHFECKSAKMTDANLAYRYVVEQYTTFGVPDAPTGAKSHWQVFVDGAAVNFTQEGTTVTVSSSLLKLVSKVRVLVTEVK